CDGMAGVDIGNGEESLAFASGVGGCLDGFVEYGNSGQGSRGRTERDEQRSSGTDVFLEGVFESTGERAEIVEDDHRVMGKQLARGLLGAIYFQRKRGVGRGIERGSIVHLRERLAAVVDEENFARIGALDGE